MSRYIVALHVPADSRSQSNRRFDLDASSRSWRRIMREMLAEPDRYLKGHSRTVTVFDTETGEKVAQEAVED